MSNTNLTKRMQWVVVCLGLLYFSLGRADLLDDWLLENHLGTKTPYRWNTLAKRDLQADLPPTCSPTPIHLNFVARHGSRGPTSADWIKFEKLMISLQKNGKYIQNPQYDWMKSWENPYSPDISGQLSLYGEQEHYNMSKRYLAKYEELFNLPYTPLIYPFQSTVIPRTGQSGSAFAFGLFEGKGQIGESNFQPTFSFTQSETEDLTLRFFDNCPNFISDVLNNASTKVEAKKYLDANINKTVAKITKLLGVNSDDWNISDSDVTQMYKACFYEIAVLRETSKFCSLFDKDDIDMMEYSTDLQEFYQRGYGSELGHSISCPLLVDFMDKIDSAINSPLKTPQRAYLRFAHAETIMPFVTLLGLFDDHNNLYWNSSQDTIANRKWRMSQASPFAANVAFVLYNCSQDAEAPYRVQLLHNEQSYAFPRCNNEMFCPLNVLKDAYSKEIQCDFQSMCFPAVESSSNDVSASSISEPTPSSDSEVTSVLPPDNNSGNNENNRPSPGLVIFASAISFAVGIFVSAMVATVYFRAKLQQGGRVINHWDSNRSSINTFPSLSDMGYQPYSTSSSESDLLLQKDPTYRV